MGARRRPAPARAGGERSARRAAAGAPRRLRGPRRRPSRRDGAGEHGVGERGADRPANPGEPREPRLHSLHLRLDGPAQGGGADPPDAEQPGGLERRGAGEVRGAGAPVLATGLRRLLRGAVLHLGLRGDAGADAGRAAARSRRPALAAGGKADRAALPALRGAATARRGRPRAGTAAGGPVRGGHRRRAAAGDAGARRPLRARRGAVQRVRADRDPRRHRAPARGTVRALAGPAADRPADRQPPHAGARPPPPAPSRRSAGGAVHRRRRRRPRLSRPSGPHGRTVHP